MRRIDLIEKIKEVGLFNKDICNFLESEIKKDVNVSDTDSLNDTIKVFVSKLRTKFKKHNCMYSR